MQLTTETSATALRLHRERQARTARMSQAAQTARLARIARMKAWAIPEPKPEPQPEPQPAPVVIVPPPGPIFFLVTKAPPRQVTIALIQKATAAHFGIDIEWLKSPRQSRSIAYWRQIAMHAARKYTKHPLPVIGRLFARDHTTVLFAVRKIESLLDDPQVAADCEDVARAIGEVV